MPSVAAQMIALLEAALASSPISVEQISMPDGESVRYRKRSELLAELQYWYRQQRIENSTVQTRVAGITRGEN